MKRLSLELTTVVLLVAAAMLFSMPVNWLGAESASTASVINASSAELIGTSNIVSIGTPGAVQNLSISQCSENLTLTWEPPTDEEGLNVTYYNIYQAGPPQAEVLIGSVNGTVRSYSSTGYSDNTTYAFHVAAVNSAGEGEHGTGVNMTYYAPPSAPLGLHVEYFDYESSIRLGTYPDCVILAWQAPECSNNGSITRYDIFRMGQSTSEWLLCGSSSNLSFCDATTYPFGIYSYRVSACVMDQVSGPFSNIVDYGWTPPTEPLNISARISGIGSLNITWEEPLSIGASKVHYWIKVVPLDDQGQEESPLEGSPFTTNRTFFDLTGLENGKRYRLSVTAKNVIDEGPSSVTITALTASEPYPPTIKYVKQDGWGNLTFEWDPPPVDDDYPLLNYSLYRGLSMEDLSFIKYLPFDQTCYTDRDLLDNTVYYYRIAGNNLVGEGHFAGFYMMTDGHPSAPRNLTAVVSKGNVTLTWDIPEHIGGGFTITITKMYNLSEGLPPVSLPVALIPNGIGVTSFVDTHIDLSSGHSWCYVVRASNMYGSSESSPAYLLPYYAHPGTPTEDNGAGSDMTLPLATFGLIAATVLFFAYIGTRKGKRN